MSTIEERVKKIVVDQLGVKEEEVTNTASFVDDLGADSLDTVELVMALEEEFECEIPDEEAEKISLFTNVPRWGVISMWDVDTIYKVPRMLHEQGLDGLICDKLRLNTPPTSLKR